MKKIINGVEYTTFEPNKNATELGIDTTRKFIVVGGFLFNVGDIVKLEKDYNDCVPLFKRISDGKILYESWENLAYYDELKFKVGDMVRIVQSKNSACSRNYLGRIGKIIKIGNNHYGYWASIVDDNGIEIGGGAYLDELELIEQNPKSSTPLTNTIITNIKDAAQHKRVQKKLFEMGCEWVYSGKIILSLQKNHIIIDNNSKMSHWLSASIEHIRELDDGKKEITADEFLEEESLYEPEYKVEFLDIEKAQQMLDEQIKEGIKSMRYGMWPKYGQDHFNKKLNNTPNEHRVAKGNKNMKITKQQVLENLEDVKKYIQEAETKKEEKVVGIAIKNRFTGEIIFQSTKTTYKKAVEEACRSGADLSGANLSGADLSDANLGDANLGDANLSGTNLRDAYLRDANLSDADLSGADLSGANLSGADLSDANLGDANLGDANLSGTNLRDAYLRDANLSGAYLSGADLSGAELNCAKFYGRGGSIVIKKKDLEGFLGALGFKLGD